MLTDIEPTKVWTCNRPINHLEQKRQKIFFSLNLIRMIDSRRRKRKYKVLTRKSDKYLDSSWSMLFIRKITRFCNEHRSLRIDIFEIFHEKEKKNIDRFHWTINSKFSSTLVCRFWFTSKPSISLIESFNRSRKKQERNFFQNLHHHPYITEMSIAVPPPQRKRCDGGRSFPTLVAVRCSSGEFFWRNTLKYHEFSRNLSTTER